MKERNKEKRKKCGRQKEEKERTEKQIKPYMLI